MKWYVMFKCTECGFVQSGRYMEAYKGTSPRHIEPSCCSSCGEFSFLCGTAQTRDAYDHIVDQDSFKVPKAWRLLVSSDPVEL